MTFLPGTSTGQAHPSLEGTPSTLAKAPMPVPKGTTVVLALDQDVSSKSNATGDMFPIHLAEPLVIDGQVMIPQGTKGLGQVVHAAKARFGGNSGELILAARYLELDGIRIALRSFQMRGRGADNSAEALAVGLLVPMASFIVSGGNKVLPKGAQGTAKIAADISLPVLGRSPVSVPDAATAPVPPSNP